MTTIPSISNAQHHYDKADDLEKLLAQQTEKPQEQLPEQIQVQAEPVNSAEASKQNQRSLLNAEKAVEKHLTSANEYAQRIKEKICVNELQEADHYTQMALEIKKAIENILGTVTEEDLKQVFKENYDPEKLSVDLLAKVINQNKAAYRINDFDKLQKEVDASLQTFEVRFSDVENLRQIITALKENNLPVDKKNIEKMIQVIEKTKDIQTPTNQTLVNLMKQNKTVTIENIYKAKYMAEQSPKAEDTLKPLEDQIKSLLKAVKLETSKSNIQLSKMLIQNDVPLNEENLNKIKTIKEQLGKLKIDTVIDQAAENLAAKKPVAAIPILEQVELETIDLDKLKRIIEKIPEIETLHIEKVIRKNQTINLDSLIKEAAQRVDEKESAKESTKESVKEQPKQAATEDLKVIKATLNLEEIRLKMTLEVANQLTVKGIKIDVEPLEDLVKHLKQLERDTYAKQLETYNVEASDENISKIEEVYAKVGYLRDMPPKVYEKVIKQEVDFTIEALAKDIRSEQVLEKAMKNYELLGTKPRQDLGDRLEKTYNQIDSILEDLKVEVTQSNVRAVKILARNEMPITIELIETVKLLDYKVIEITEKLHPNIVVNMIKEQQSPLDMHIDKVLEYISDFKMKTGVTADEQIANAIHTLDTNKTLSTEERESLIGIYRMFSTVSKSKGAAVGFLIKNNLPLSMNNLFEAAKYIKQNKGDQSLIQADIDDGFGILTDVKFEGKPIKEQIEAAIQKDHMAPTKNLMDLIKGLSEAKVNIDAQTLHQAASGGKVLENFMDNMSFEKMMTLYKSGALDNTEVSLEHLSEVISNITTEEEPAQDIPSLLEKIKNLSRLDLDMIKSMSKYKIPSNLSNLFTASEFENDPFTLVKKLEHINKALEQEGRENNGLKEHFMADKKDNPLETYEADMVALKKQLTALQGEMSANPGEHKSNANKNIEQTLQLLDFQTVIKAQENYYQIPMIIGGKLTQMNMYYLKDQKGNNQEKVEAMNVYLYFQTENMGKIQAHIQLEDNRMDFNMYTADSKDMALLKSFEEPIKTILNNTKYNLGKVDFGFFEGKSPIQEGAPIPVQEKVRKHQESQFETIV